MNYLRYLTIRGVTVWLILFFSNQTGAQNTLFDIIYCINGGENKSVGLPSVPFINPVEKPGWKLIFSDEFAGDSLNPLKWNRSTPFDDGNGSCVRKFAMNPANISVGEGYALIRNSAEEYIAGCPFSSGEIKTMSVRDTTFNSYYFYSDGYVEARVQLYSKPGQGAAMWLWGIGDPLNPGGPGPWSEIDLFELDGANANIADGTYHWSWLGKHTWQLQNVYLTSDANIYDLSQNWTTFGLEWNADTIRWYINNTLVKALDLHRVPPFCLEVPGYAQPLAPYCLRFGTGPNSVGNMTALANAADLPQTMKIDYVRVYKKNGSKATPILTTDGIPQLCFDTLNPAAAEKIIWAPYYPEVMYAWSSPSFEITPAPLPIPVPPQRMVIRPKPGIQPDSFHPVFLKAIFPGNRTEYDTLMIYLPSVPPLLPEENFSAVAIDTLCYFQLSKPVSPGISEAEYSINQGVDWILARKKTTANGLFFCFDTIRPETTRNFLWREWNGCGASPPLSTSFTTPSPIPGCKWPVNTNEKEVQPLSGENNITISPCPATSGTLTVSFNPNPSELPEPLYLKITDAGGRLVVNQILSESTNTLNISHLKNGVFFISIETARKILYHGSCIKQ